MTDDVSSLLANTKRVWRDVTYLFYQWLTLSSWRHISVPFWRAYCTPWWISWQTLNIQGWPNQAHSRIRRIDFGEEFPLDQTYYNKVLQLNSISAKACFVFGQQFRSLVLTKRYAGPRNLSYLHYIQCMSMRRREHFFPGACVLYWSAISFLSANSINSWKLILLCVNI